MHYPIISEYFPLEHLKEGDNVEMTGRGVGVYSGKFLRKYIIIFSSGDEEDAVEMTKDDLLTQTLCLRNSQGIKWKKSK